MGGSSSDGGVSEEIGVLLYTLPGWSVVLNGDFALAARKVLRIARGRVSMMGHAGNRCCFDG